MAQTVNYDVRGLWTNPNDISKVPNGSLRVAKNIDLSKTGLITPQRGFDIQGTLPNTSYRAKKLFFYGGQKLVHFNDILALADGTYASKGALITPTRANSVRMASLQRNAYFTSSVGIKKLDTASGNLYAAGVPKGLNIAATLLGGGGTAIGASRYRKYRFVLGRKDANGNTVFGGVSDSQTVQNAGGTAQNCLVVCYLPDGLDTSFFIQLYASPNSTVPEINEELQLAYEKVLESGDISAGGVQITDIVPDALLGATIYTASSQEGISQDNGSGPPLARDIAEYKGRLWYADVESILRFSLTVVAIGGTDGIQAGDTFVVTSGVTVETFTAHSTGIPANTFKVFTGGSLAQNIYDTTRDLIRAINADSSLVYAYTVTDETGLPGKMRLEARTMGAPAFTVTASRAKSWNPNLAAVANANQTATKDAHLNGLMYSKAGQGEAVPLANLYRVGSADDPILRIVTLREGLFILKESGGVYILVGDDPGTFSITLLDGTCRVVAPDSVLTLNNLIYGLFEAGIGTVTTSGAEYFSEPIQDKILALYGTALEATKKSFAFASQTEGKYFLCLPSSSADTYSTYQLHYLTYSRAFVEADRAMTCADVSPDGKIHYGLGNGPLIKIERKTFTYTDFVEEIRQVDIVSNLGAILTVDSTEGMEQGDSIDQDGVQIAFIQNVLSETEVQVDVAVGWDPSKPATLYKAIDVDVEWNREFAANPAGFKHFSEMQILFKRAPIGNARVLFSTDLAPGLFPVPLKVTQYLYGWGASPWGSQLWGEEALPAPFRLGVPRACARCNAMTVIFRSHFAYSDFQLSGLSLVFNPISTRGTR